MMPNNPFPELQPLDSSCTETFGLHYFRTKRLQLPPKLAQYWTRVSWAICFCYYWCIVDVRWAPLPPGVPDGRAL